MASGACLIIPAYGWKFGILSSFSRSVMTTNLHGWMPPAVGADMAALSNSLTRSSPTGRFRNWRMLRRVWRTSKASIRTLLSLGLCSLHHTRTVFVAPEPICRAPSVKMPCSPHGCLDILFRRVRACHCVIMRVFFPVWTKKRGVRSCCVRTPDVFRLLAFFLHSFS